MAFGLESSRTAQIHHTFSDIFDNPHQNAKIVLLASCAILQPNRSRSMYLYTMLVILRIIRGYIQG